MTENFEIKVAKIQAKLMKDKKVAKFYKSDELKKLYFDLKLISNNEKCFHILTALVYLKERNNKENVKYFVNEVEKLANLI